jgi:glycosyltransferase involved in cell wall biosynthesis
LRADAARELLQYLTVRRSALAVEGHGRDDEKAHRARRTRLHALVSGGVKEKKPVICLRGLPSLSSRHRMRRLRLLWVVPHLPLRGVSAARERWWHLLTRLAPRHDVTLLAFADPEDGGRTDGLPPGLAALHVAPKIPWRPNDPLALLPRTVAGGYTHPGLGAAIAERLAAERYDVVQYEFSEMANLIPGPAPRTILTVHQVGFAQQGPAWRAEHGGLRRAAVLLHRHLRELDFELRAVRRVDHVVTMSGEDAARLRRFAPDLRISVSPCGVDLQEFRPPDAPSSPAVDVSFVGHFGHPPNVDAVSFLVNEVVPRLGRPARVRVVGRGVTPEVARLARPGVEVTGPVADVRPHLAAGAVFAAPIRFGTGMRGKVLEALAMGRPVVTTPLGAEGLGATAGRHLLVAEGSADFAAAVRRVLDDPARAAELGRAGRALVEARFGWDAIAMAHEHIYDDVLRAPARAVPPPAARAHPLVARLGPIPAVGVGFALLVGRAVRWHLGRLGHRAAPLASHAPTLEQA